MLSREIRVAVQLLAKGVASCEEADQSMLKDGLKNAERNRS